MMSGIGFKIIHWRREGRMHRGHGWTKIGHTVLIDEARQ